ncbi:hypothetical protein AHAS_Ahas17G0243400 [Arachis hypogaea]
MRNMMNPLDCYLKMICLLKLSEKSTRLECVAKALDRLLVNSLVEIHISRVMAHKQRGGT